MTNLCVTFSWIILCVYTMLSYVHPSVIFRDQSATEYKETVQIHFISKEFGTVRNKSYAAFLEDELVLEFKMRGEAMRMELEWNELIGLNPPVYVQRGGEIVRETLTANQNIKHYLERKFVGAFTVTCKRTEENTCRYIMEGTFVKGSQLYLISPRPDWKTTVSRTRASFTHLITIQPSRAEFFNDYRFTDDVPIFLPVKNQRRRMRRAGKENYFIELLMVTDYSVYQFWYNKSKSNTPEARDGETKELIRQHYAFLLNGIDLHFEDIIEADMSVRVVFAGIFIADTAPRAPWTERFDGNDLVDASLALTNFSSWVQANSGLPGHDHAMLFTTHNITSDSSSGSSAGLANYKTICTASSTSIVEDTFDFTTVTVAAHGIGHSLGAYHDGEMGNFCDGTRGFIMAAISGASEAVHDLRNPWYFSSCSVEYFRETLSALTGAGNNCLLTLSDQYNSSALDSYLAKEAGQVYNVDQQCEYALGTGSYFCRSLYPENTYEDICPGMYCSNPSNPSTCTKITPAKGTSCGSGKWCIAGFCVDDANAPLLGTCVVGDEPGVVKDGLTCAQLAEQKLWECYTNITEMCCASCKARQTGHPDCEYGDRSASCDYNLCGSYDEQTRNTTCCETCRNVPSTTLIPESTTQATTTPESTTLAITTPEGTTQETTTPESTTQAITTLESTTQATTTPKSTPQATTTPKSTTQATTTQVITNPESTTQAITTLDSTTQATTIPDSTAQANTSPESTTQAITTPDTTTLESTTTIQAITTSDSTTQAATTRDSTTSESSPVSTTPESITSESTSATTSPESTTQAPTSQVSTTLESATHTTPETTTQVFTSPVTTASITTTQVTITSETTTPTTLLESTSDPIASPESITTAATTPATSPSIEKLTLEATTTRIRTSQPITVALIMTNASSATTEAMELTTQPPSTTTMKLTTQPPPTTMMKLTTRSLSTTAMKLSTQPSPTTMKLTTQLPSTTMMKLTPQPPSPTTMKPTTQSLSTTTMKLTTQPSSTTMKLTTQPSSTMMKPTTQLSTTMKPTTQSLSSTMMKPTTQLSTTMKLTTQPPSTTMMKFTTQPSLATMETTTDETQSITIETTTETAVSQTTDSTEQPTSNGVTRTASARTRSFFEEWGRIIIGSSVAFFLVIALPILACFCISVCHRQSDKKPDLYSSTNTLVELSKVDSGAVRWYNESDWLRRRDFRQSVGPFYPVPKVKLLPEDDIALHEARPIYAREDLVLY